MSATLDLTKELISRPSITPNDAGCQEIIAKRLKKIGFTIENLRFADVDNLWARRGTQKPLFVLAGHTDVVPPGPLADWTSDPFQPTERDGFLYGRGAADMKSGLAAMIVAVERFIEKNPNFAGSIAFLITSDEEGAKNLNGTKKVIETLEQRNVKIDYCLIGEASSENFLGDQIRVGRRGSLSGNLTIYGKQGHIALPQNAINPIHTTLSALKELTATNWDQGNDFFPATSFQISNIHAGTGVGNVIPGRLDVAFNFRFSNAITAEQIQNKVAETLMNHSLSFDLQWDLSGNPFLTVHGKLTTAAEHAIKEVTKLDSLFSTGGGTSDGRFIAPTGAEVIELGPVNSTIHQVNEKVKIEDLNVLTQIYESILRKILIE